MILKTYLLPPIDNNNYLIADESTKEAALIDCSGVNDELKRDLESLGVTLKYILLTHGHFDHIAGIRPDKDVKIYMHKGDVDWVKNVNTYMPMMGMPEMTIPKIDVYVEDNDIINLGNLDIRVITTPGHTQGGVCYYVDGKLFSGDTIFRESVGRCDLAGGNFEQIVQSIENKIYKLPGNTIIYPGHGRPTTVGWEKEHNCYL